MKPGRFEYVAPRSEDEALATLAEHGDRAKILAGRQSLIPLMNFRLAQPEVVIDVNRLADLAYVRSADGGVAIGALTRQHALERDPTVRAPPDSRRGLPSHRPPADPAPRTVGAFAGG